MPDPVPPQNPDQPHSTVDTLVAEAGDRERIRKAIAVAVLEEVDGVIDPPDQTPDERPLGLPNKMDDGSPRPLDGPPPTPSPPLEAAVIQLFSRPPTSSD
jgi:hypothetical protein